MPFVKSCELYIQVYANPELARQQQTCAKFCTHDSYKYRACHAININPRYTPDNLTDSQGTTDVCKIFAILNLGSSDRDVMNMSSHKYGQIFLQIHAIVGSAADFKLCSNSASHSSAYIHIHIGNIGVIYRNMISGCPIFNQRTCTYLITLFIDDP